MNEKEFLEWKETEDYKHLGVHSNVILYKNFFTGVNGDWEWGIWGGRDVPDEWLAENQRDYGYLEIKRMRVHDILNQDSPKYDYVKKWALESIK